MNHMDFDYPAAAGDCGGGVMAFFVYHNSGSCNYGDHSWDLEEFDTLEEAQRFFDGHKAYDSDSFVTLIEGNTVREWPPPTPAPARPER